MTIFTIIENGLPTEITRYTLQERAHRVGLSDVYVESCSDEELQRVLLVLECQ